MFRGISINNNYLYAIGTRTFVGNFIRTENNYNYYNYEKAAYLVKIDLSGRIVSETKLGGQTDIGERYFLNDRTGSTGFGGRKSSCKRT